MSDAYKYIDPDYSYTDPETGLLRNLQDIPAGTKSSFSFKQLKNTIAAFHVRYCWCDMQSPNILSNVLKEGDYTSL